MNNSAHKSRLILGIELIFLYLVITDSLAFLQGDSTLTFNFLTSPVVALKYLLLFVSFVLISQLKERLNFRYLWLPIVIWIVHFLSSLNGKLYTSPLNLISLCAFLVLPDSIKIDILKKYRLWLIIMAAGGIVAYLSYALSLGLPFRICDYYSSKQMMAFYVDYYFSVIFQNGLELRLCGLFNEPGYFGTVLALTLILDDCNFKKIGNIILIFAGVLTFSMAFYLLLGIYAMLRAFKNIATVLIFISVFGVFLSVIQNTQFEDPQIQHLVDRFTFDKSTGEMSGDNRTDENFELAYQRMIDNGNLLLGEGMYTKEGTNFTSSSYKTLIYKHGLLGFMVIVGGMFTAAYPIAKRNRRALIFLLCYFISIYQRPNVYNMTYFCLLFAGLLYIKEEVFCHKTISK